MTGPAEGATARLADSIDMAPPEPGLESQQGFSKRPHFV